jgi:hypothetical protein
MCLRVSQSLFMIHTWRGSQSPCDTLPSLRVASLYPFIFMYLLVPQYTFVCFSNNGRARFFVKRSELMVAPEVHSVGMMPSIFRSRRTRRNQCYYVVMKLVMTKFSSLHAVTFKPISLAIYENVV